jgi:hypothetical protein
MRKLIASIILSFALLLPLTMVATPVFAQTATDTTTTTAPDDTTYYDTYDYGYDDTYDDSYSSYSYDTDGEAGVFAGLAAMLFGGVMLVFTIVIGLGSYIYCGLALMKIAKRLNHENAWFAWIPILNLVLMFQLGEQNPVLLLLLLIPGVGAVVVGVLTIIASMKICEKRGYDKMLGLLSLIPVANYVLFGILAWGKNEPVAAVK